MKEDIQPEIYAALPNSHTVESILARARQEYYKRRMIITYVNYRYILVLTQPTLNSCVQVINGQQPELSAHEIKNMVTIAPFSDVTQILPDQSPHTPPQIVFGPEPPKGWCYLYEKASLARQQGDWKTVVRLGEEAFNQKYSPADTIEWMPFLQGYALAGRTNRVTQIARRLATQPQVRAQACQILSKMSGLNANLQKQTQTLFCSP